MICSIAFLFVPVLLIPLERPTLMTYTARSSKQALAELHEGSQREGLPYI